ncbi:MAG: hypothetical protein ACE5ES_06025, partial [Candidatus Nanoarchaeia archaeon]
MPLTETIHYTPPEGVRIEYDEPTGAKGYQIRAETLIAPDHHLQLIVAKAYLGPDSFLNQKLLPTVVRLDETEPEKRRLDFYAFDNHGTCLVHTYSLLEGGIWAVDEKHDTDTSRLKEHGKVIMEMLGDYHLPMPMIGNP